MRRATKQLSEKFILGTLDRLRMITRYNVEVIADLLIKSRYPLTGRHDTQFLGEYLIDVSQVIQEKLGYDPDRQFIHPCDECGEDVDRNHNGARFCSNACRQKAYRKRV